jgi:hypothetical protein
MSNVLLVNDPSFRLARNHLSSHLYSFLKTKDSSTETVGDNLKSVLHQGLINLASNNEKQLNWQSLFEWMDSWRESFSWIDSWRDLAKGIKREDAQVFANYVSKRTNGLPAQVRNFLGIILNKGMNKLYPRKRKSNPDWQGLGNYLSKQLAPVIQALNTEQNTETPVDINTLNDSMNQVLADVSSEIINYKRIYTVASPSIIQWRSSQTRQGEKPGYLETLVNQGYEEIKKCVAEGADINHRARLNDSYINHRGKKSRSQKPLSFTPLQLGLIFKDYPWVIEQLKKPSLKPDEQIAKGQYNGKYYEYNLLDAVYLFPEYDPHIDGQAFSNKRKLEVVRMLIRKGAKVSKESLLKAFETADVDFFEVINEESKRKIIPIDKKLLNKLLPILFIKPCTDNDTFTTTYELRNNPTNKRRNRNSIIANKADLQNRIKILKILAEYSNTTVKELLNKPLPEEIRDSASRQFSRRNPIHNTADWITRFLETTKARTVQELRDCLT